VLALRKVMDLSFLAWCYDSYDSVMMAGTQVPRSTPPKILVTQLLRNHSKNCSRFPFINPIFGVRFSVGISILFAGGLLAFSLKE
jgi:hypothetical protein